MIGPVELAGDVSAGQAVWVGEDDFTHKGREGTRRDLSLNFRRYLAPKIAQAGFGVAFFAGELVAKGGAAVKRPRVTFEENWVSRFV